jgi:hypothetical protein
MLSLPIDIFEIIIRQLLIRKDKLTIKSLSLVCSSLTPLCQKHLLFSIVITCLKAEHGSKHYRHSTYATRELLQSSPRIIPLIKSLTVFDSGSSWTHIDHSLIYILHSLTSLEAFTWRPSSFSSCSNLWGELPASLQDAIRLVIQRPPLKALTLHFTDLTKFLYTKIIISPSLSFLSLRSTGYSSLTFELAGENGVACDEAKGTNVSNLFVMSCKFEWVCDDEMFLGWMSTISPYLSLVNLRKLVTLRCRLGSAPAGLPWTAMLHYGSAWSKLEELWFDIVSTDVLSNGWCIFQTLHPYPNCITRFYRYCTSQASDKLAQTWHRRSPHSR